MKLKIAVLAVLMAGAHVWAETQSEDVDGVTWYYSVLDKKATIVSGGGEYSGNLAIPSSLGGSPVVGVGDRAFYGSTGLSSVTIPNSVTNVAPTAFEGCSNIVDVIIGGIPRLEQLVPISNWTQQPDGSWLPSLSSNMEIMISGPRQIVFKWTLANRAGRSSYGCLRCYVDGVLQAEWRNVAWETVTVDVPSGKHEIIWSFSRDRENSCWSYIKLESGFGADMEVLFPDSYMKIKRISILPSVKAISDSFFAGCDELSRVDIQSMDDWLNVHFDNASANPLSTGAKLFIGGVEVTDLVVPEGVTEIGEYSFCGGQFASVTIPNSVTNISETAFVGCSNIVAVTVPSCVNVAKTFPNSKDKVTHVTLSRSGAVPESAYSGCTMLRRVDAASIDEWLSFRFANAEANPLHTGAALYVDGEAVTVLEIPDGVLGIGAHAFEGGQFTSVIIPASVADVAATAFSGCTNLNLVSLGVMPTEASEFYPSVTTLESWQKDGECYFTKTSGMMSCTVHGPCKLRFDWQTIFDWKTLIYMQCKVDGVVKVSNKGGDQNWHNVQVDISDGDHVVVWEPCFFSSDYEGRGENRISDITLLYDQPTMRTLFPNSFANLTNVILREGVRTVPDDFFEGCALLARVDLPIGLESIGTNAFGECESLSQVNVPSLADWANISFANAAANPLSTGAKLYIYGKEMVDLVIPEGVTEIKQYAFQGGQFSSVSIPNGVTNVVATAFAGCSNVEDVIIGCVPSVMPISDWTQQMDGSWRSNAIRPNSRTDLKMFVCGPTQIVFKWKLSAKDFADLLRWSLDGIQMDEYRQSTVDSDWVTVVADIPSGRHEIRWSYSSEDDYYIGTIDYGGEDCGWVMPISGFTSFGTLFPDSYAKVNRLLVLPSVTAFTDDYFVGCDELLRVDSQSISDWLNIDFANAAANPLYKGAVFYVGGEEVSELVIPGGTTDVGDYSFVNGRFTSVTIPDSVTNVSVTAFRGCTNIVEVTVPSWLNVASIFDGSKDKIAHVTLVSSGDVPAMAYDGCTAIERVDVRGMEEWLALRFANATANPLHSGAVFYVGGEEVAGLMIPDGATEIGDYAFVNGQFTSVMIPSSVTNVATSAFIGCENIVDVEIGGELLCDAEIEVVGEVRVCDYPEGDWTDLGNGQYRSKAISHDGSTEMSVHLNLDEPQTCSFKWKVSCESYYDKLEYSVDGVRVAEISGSTDWETKQMSLDAGVHTIVWRYYKDFMVTSGEDCGWVDISGLLELKETTTVTCVGQKRVALADLFPDSAVGIKSVRIASDVSVLDEAFLAGCSSLETLVLPESMKRIEAGALDDCPAIKSVTLPEVSQLEDFGLDDILEAQREALGLHYDADGFMIWNGWLLDYENREASELTVPEGVIGIGHYALSDMELERLTLPSTLKYIGSQAISYQWALEELEIPDSVEYIGPGAFEDCSYMGTITFGSGLREIGKRAFAECMSLATASPAFGLETVGDEAFADCVKLLSVSLPVTVTNVVATAFAGCKSLVGVMTPTATAPLSQWFMPIYGQIRNVTVSAGEVEVCGNMFKGCSAMVNASLPEGVTNIGARAFMDCSQLSEIALPSTLVSVGDEAFRNCDALTAIGLPNEVERLGARAFYDCNNLQNISLSRNLSELPDQTFDSCGRLDSIVVPASVTNLGARVFGSTMRSVYYLGDAPTYDADVYAATASSLTTYVNYGTFGWDGLTHSRNLPPSWPVGNDYSRAIATWTPVRYDVTFDAGNGVFTSPVAARTYACEQVVGTAYSLPPYNPVRTGFKFDGWWDSETGGTRITPSTGVQLQKAHTLYAHWTQGQTITVRFNANGGNVTPRELQYVAGAPYGEFPLPTREHHVFDGWFTAPQGGRLVRISMEAPLADRELFAHWSPARYLICYHANNGTDAAMSQSLVYGESVLLRRNPFVCADCTFAGWSVVPGGAAVYGDGHVLESIGAIEDGVIDLYAVWTGKTYAVRFDANGGVGQMENQTFVVGVGQPLLACSYTRNGYAFLGWALSPSAQIKFVDEEIVAGLSAHAGGTVDLFAVWGIAGQMTRIILDAGEGTVGVASFEREPGERFGVLPVPVRDGFAFGGWRDAHGDLVTEDSLVPPGEVTLTADWGPAVRVRLRFAHGWRLIWRPCGHFFGRLPVLPREQAPHPGWRFRCWAYDLAGERLVSPADLVPEVDTDLYAVWVPEDESEGGETLHVEYDDTGFVIWDGWLLSCQNKNVVSIAIPEGVVGIGRGALADMYDLQTVMFPSTLREIGDGAFANDTYLDLVELPEGVVRIGEEAFANCTWLQSLSIGDGVETVGAGAFKGCAQLAKVEFGEGLADVGAEAFADCWRMLSAALPLSVTNVDATAFSGCSSLTGLTVPTHCALLSAWFAPVVAQVRDVTVLAGETEVCSNMFKGCSSLVSVSLPEGVTNIAEGAFWDCSALPGVVLPSSLLEVGADAFRNCDALTAIGLPESVERIGARAFYDCYSLADASLSRCLTELPEQVFDGCAGLDSIVVPESVTNLGPRVFGSAMRAVYYVGNAPQYDDDVYAVASESLTTYVKQGSKGWEGRDKPKSRVLPERWPADNAYSRPLTTWEPVQYDVTFDAGEGVFYPVQTNIYACQQTVGTAYSLPPYNPTCVGRKFAGWWTEAIGGAQITPSTGVKLDREHTLYAHWAGGTVVTVRFNGCGGVVEPNECQYTAGETYGRFPVPTREHHVFLGWYTAPTGGGRVRESMEVPSADCELFAQWAPAPYEIRFHANNGTGATISQNFVYGQTVTLWANVFMCSGCSFAGWSLTPGGVAVYADRATIPGLAAIEDGVINLYAAWAGNVHAVRFDSHGGTGAMANQTFVIGVEQPLSPCGFVRAGYVFAGWARLTDGEVCFGDMENVSALTEIRNATVVLYAVWERDPAAVWTLNEYLNCTNLTFALGGDEPHWHGLKTTRADMAGMMQSGAIGDAQTNWIETVVCGPGTIRFWWKASGEFETSKKGVITRYDFAEFTVDGEVQAEIGDESEWTEVVYVVTGTRAHTIRWMYHKDESGSDGEDCAWLSEVEWTPDPNATEPIPELGSSADAAAVRTALEGSVDARLLENITDVATYGAYREWALRIGAAEVKASPNAWASFAVDSAALLDKMPTADDLKIEEFTPSAMVNSFDFTVSVKDMAIGDKASKDNLNKLFSLEGAESLDPSAFLSANVVLDFKAPQDGKVKFTATPAVHNAKSFFMRMKVK